MTWLAFEVSESFARGARRSSSNARYVLLDSGALSRAPKLEGQLREAAASAASQVAEGYGRWNPADFARFVVMARSSTIECQNHLDDAVDRRLLADDKRAAYDQLAEEAKREMVGLIDYLQSPQAEENARHAKTRRIARREHRTKNANPNKNGNQNEEPGTGNSEPQ